MAVQTVDIFRAVILKREMSSERPCALARRDAKVFDTTRQLTEDKKKYNKEIEDFDKIIYEYL